MNGNNFNGADTSLDQRIGINERPLDLLSYNNALRRECDKTAASIYEKPEPTPKPVPGDKNYFYIENPDNKSISVTITNGGDTGTPFDSIEISDDKENWSELILDNDEYTFDVLAESKIYIRAEQSSWKDWLINTEGKDVFFNVGGNIMSLLYGENFEDETTLESIYTFDGLFRDSGVVDASELILPATILSERCYSYMFNGCTSLTEAPQLLATTLASGCYIKMFFGCESLTSAPELPATELAHSCYGSMFQGCESLTEAPELPATTLAEMCYRYMFSGCTSLNKIITYANDISASSCLGGWLGDVAQTGTFYNLGGATYEQDSDSGIPEGWIIKTELPQE